MAVLSLVGLSIGWCAHVFGPATCPPVHETSQTLKQEFRGAWVEVVDSLKKI